MTDIRKRRKDAATSSFNFVQESDEKDKSYFRIKRWLAYFPWVVLIGIIAAVLMTSEFGHSDFHSHQNLFWINDTWPDWPVGIKKEWTRHPLRTTDFNKATIHFVPNFYWAPLIVNYSIPNLSKENPWLIWGLPGMGDCDENWTSPTCEAREAILSREDILWVDLSMRVNHLFNDSESSKSRGVTYPPRNVWTDDHFFEGSKGHPTNPEYFFTFRGQLCDPQKPASQYMGRCGPRILLQKAFFNHTYPGVVMEFLPFVTGQATYRENEAYKDRFGELMNTSFALVPSGFNRWSFRFIDAIGACAIPVLISDGLTLPFEQIIEWDELVIWIPEKFSNDSAYIMDHLFTDKEKINKRRERICEIYEKYFADHTKRFDALIASAFWETQNS